MVLGPPEAVKCHFSRVKSKVGAGTCLRAKEVRKGLGSSPGAEGEGGRNQRNKG